MTCQSFQNLNIVEKHLMIGKIVHLIQEDTMSFDRVKDLIEWAELIGMFNDVKILPEKTNSEHDG